MHLSEEKLEFHNLHIWSYITGSHNFGTIYVESESCCLVCYNCMYTFLKREGKKQKYTRDE